MSPLSAPAPAGLRMDKRLAWLICGFATLYSGFAVRLIQLQVWDHEKYAGIARGSRTIKLSVPARRGNVCDARGEILAANQPLQKIVIDGTRLGFVRPNGAATLGKNASIGQQRQFAVETARRLADILANCLTLDAEKRDAAAEQIERSLVIRESAGETEGARKGSPYVVLQRRVAGDAIEHLQAAIDTQKIRGVFFEPDAKRVYPNGSLLSHVLGFLNHDGVGVQGVEMTMERYLAGQAGYRWIERDQAGRELAQYRGVEQAPRNGDDVILTIDSAIQTIVEQELDAAVQKYRPDMASVVMMHPRTGEIMALASRPDYDPNLLRANMGDEARNRAIADMVEPGSTFKIVTVAAGLNESKVRPETQIFCENGRWDFGGSLLHDAHPYGYLSVHDVIMHSSNIGAAKLAVQLGSRPFHGYIRRFGFGERTGIELPGEAGGIVHPVDKWSAISISRIPMGHEVGVTPLQMTAAMCVIANGGEWVTPRVVRSIRDSQTGEASSTLLVPPRRVISEKTAAQLRVALHDVVGPKGTARLAAVRGYQVAGKTGTAQKVDSKKGGYIHGQYIVSFVGFLPAENPEFVCLVMLDNAHTKSNENFGGQVAGPIFSRIAERTARALGLEPSPDAANPGTPQLAKAVGSD